MAKPKDRAILLTNGLYLESVGTSITGAVSRLVDATLYSYNELGIMNLA